MFSREFISSSLAFSSFASVPKWSRQIASRLLSHVQYAEGPEESPERDLLLALDLGDDVLRGLLAETLERRDFLLAQGEDVGGIADQAFVLEAAQTFGPSS